MKREVKSVTLFILIGFLFFFIGSGNIILNAQEGTPQIKPGGTPQVTKKQQTGLVEDWLNDFESCEDWRAFATCPIGDTKIRKTHFCVYYL